MIILDNIIEFDWDEGNVNKNFTKHLVSNSECEEIFFNIPLFVINDEKHSKTENRYYALGITNNNRKLYIVFTVRNNKIRIISARDMNKKEREIYENKKNTNARIQI